MDIDDAVKFLEAGETCSNKECELKHKQLAEWLKELKNYRETLSWWADVRMKGYSDSQYGKRELKKLLEIK